MSAPRTLLPRDERRAQLLRAAAATFAVEGFAATSVDEVAKSAGITRLIVYRHFESKAALYRAILEVTSDRLVEEWQAATLHDHTQGAAVRTVLTVARELPDGFRLLFVHASREDEFAGFARDVRVLQTDLARTLLTPVIEDELIRRWAGEALVDLLVSGVLRWVDEGDPARDEEWVGLATAGLQAVIGAWSGAGPLVGTGIGSEKSPDR